MRGDQKNDRGWCTRNGPRLGALGLVVAAGLLLWARLIVISDMPRTAVAEPDPYPAPATTANDAVLVAPTEGAPPDVRIDEEPVSKGGPNDTLTGKSIGQVAEDRK